MSEQNNELTTNLGELFKTDVQGLKSKDKFTKIQDQIDEAKPFLKTLDPDGEILEEKEKVKSIINCLYTGHNLVRQYKYLKDKKTVMDVLSLGFHTVASKEESLQKAKNDWQAEIDGY